MAMRVGKLLLLEMEMKRHGVLLGARGDGGVWVGEDAKDVGGNFVVDYGLVVFAGDVDAEFLLFEFQVLESEGRRSMKRRVVHDNKESGEHEHKPRRWRRQAPGCGGGGKNTDRDEINDVVTSI